MARHTTIILIALTLLPKLSPAQDQTPKTSWDKAQKRLQQLKNQQPQSRPRSLPWRGCLLDALTAARAQNKGIFLWVYTHKPKQKQCCVFTGANQDQALLKQQLIERLQDQFIPLALRSQDLDNAQRQNPKTEEAQRLRRLAQSMPASSAYATLNLDGQVLDWAVRFDNDKALEQFLNNQWQRFNDQPKFTANAKIGQFLNYPKVQRPSETAKTSQPKHWTSKHPPKRFCRGRHPWPQDALKITVLGQDANKLHKQKDLFLLTPKDQAQILKHLDQRLPKPLAQSLIRQAFLGSKTHQPDGNAFNIKAQWNSCQLRLTKTTNGQAQLTGHSSILSQSPNNHSVKLKHQVTLTWLGRLSYSKNRILSLKLYAHGHEQLSFQDLRPQSHTAFGPPPALNWNSTAEFALLGAPIPATKGPLNDHELASVLGPLRQIFKTKTKQPLTLTKIQSQALKTLEAKTWQTLERAWPRYDTLPRMLKQTFRAELSKKLSQRLESDLKKILTAPQWQRLQSTYKKS